MTNRVKLAGTAAAAERASDSQVVAAQRLAATAGFAGPVRAGSGAKYFSGRKPLPRKGLRPKPRQEYESNVDKCLEVGIMREESPYPEGEGKKPEDIDQNLRQKNGEQKYGNHERVAMVHIAPKGRGSCYGLTTVLLAWYSIPTPMLLNSYWRPARLLPLEASRKQAQTAGKEALLAIIEASRKNPRRDAPRNQETEIRDSRRLPQRNAKIGLCALCALSRPILLADASRFQLALPSMCHVSENANSHKTALTPAPLPKGRGD
jgi:hypothetical protein